ncbi:FMN-binding protein [Cryocola sp. 340MFSha3.1]|uniref:FMN-binding protein n=1 Tax=Cryocola sp. 340MFSha3.1 TaxID=1169145 RepID=UPI00036E8CF2|nr:FMN-binding protein [Cryocola sp. 340MFSha3.1]
MNSRSWRGTVLFTVILVVMGATVGLKLYGVGDQVTAASTSVHSTASGTGTTSSGSESESSDATSGGSSAPSTPAPSASSSSGSSSAATTTVTGSAVQTRYGTVQVEVTFSGTTITAVKTLQSPDRDGRDIEINNQALPILQQEVLASQSANIDTVSGATYTSEGYIQSVQSAIDQR